jgi:hypothetical protein
MAGVVLWDAKTRHPTMPPSKPYHKCKSFGSWGGHVQHWRNEFINFYPKTREGAP